MSEKIIDVNVLNQHNLDMQRYGLYISRFRSLPEYRDGLKPVQRRILFAMFKDLHAIKNNRIKCAKIVGMTVGTYNPHGDSACYDALVSLANPFEVKVPLLNKQGNFGTIQGDSAAAMRYTEASLNDFSMDVIFGDLTESSQVVDWSYTYDNRALEPDFLPTKLPLLLINGSFGIALGFRVYIPRHNISEVIDATINLIENPAADVVLAPDPSMPCEIINADWKAISNKGRGAYKVRGIIDIEEYKGHTALVIKSLPDQVFLDAVISDIEDLVTKKKLVQIHDMLDETQGTTLRYIIVLKKGADPNYVREVIYKSTSITKTYSVNFEVLDGINPIRLSYKAYLASFISFRATTKFRLYCNRIQMLKTKIHERELYIKVLESGEIDNIIKKIKSQKTINDNGLIEYLIKKLDMTDIQAKFIINSSLSKLSLAYLNKYKSEAVEMQKMVDSYMRYTIDDNLIYEDIKQELLEFKRVYGTKRTSKIIKKPNEVDIPQGTFKIVITENNFIKKLQVQDPVKNRNSADPKIIMTVDNTENILIIDEMGKVFKLPIHTIPFTDKNSPGIDIRMIVKKLTSNIVDVLYEPDLKSRAEYINKSFVVIVTKAGYIKAMNIEDFITAPPSGIIFMRLDPGDAIKSIAVTNNMNNIIVFSNNHAIRMNLESIPLLKRNTKGLRSIVSNYEIDGMSLIPKDFNGELAVITDNYKVNRISAAALSVSDRAKKGHRVIKLSKTNRIMNIIPVMGNIVIPLANNNEFILDMNTVPFGSTASTGVDINGLPKDSKIVRVYMYN